MVERMEMVDRMLGESQYMTERFRSPAEQAAVQRSIAGLVGKTNKFDNTVEHLREAGMWWMETTDMVTATPAYFSFKEHAMRPKGEGARGMPESGADATGFGMSEADAIAYAESMIRLTHGGYRNVDKSAFERFVVAKPFTMFYSYMNAQLSQFIAAHADAQLLEDEGFRREAMKRIVKGYAWLLASGVAADLLVGKGPDDYDGDGQITSKDWGKYLFLKSVLYPPSTLPVVGGYLSQIGGKGAIRDPSMLPATRFAQASIKAIGSASKAMGEEGQPGDKWKAGLEALEAIGWYYGLPVVQTRRTGDFWFDILPDGVHRSEQSQAASPWQKAWDTMYGPTRGGSLGETFFGVQPGR